MSLLNTAMEKAATHERLTKEEALSLLRDGDFLSLGELATLRRRHLHPEPVVTYVVDRNINYTNVCVSGCLFCAFYRARGAKDAFLLSRDELDRKIAETLDLGGTQLLLQGGMHPELPLSYYTDLLRHIKETFAIHIHGFSPTEIAFIADREGLSISHVLHRLVEAGLGSIPGGGAEILVDEVRQKISPNKCSAGLWLDVMRTAHGMGLKTTATMMFGHVETLEDRVSHLLKIRALQDDTGGFTAFIPWTFQSANTRISVPPATAVEYLRMLAASRLVLDNVPNIQASWVTQGDKIAQAALFFGANDFGSTMIEENVVAAAGVSFRLSEGEIIRLIESAGFKAAKRDCFYNLLETP